MGERLCVAKFVSSQFVLATKQNEKLRRTPARYDSWPAHAWRGEMTMIIENTGGISCNHRQGPCSCENDFDPSEMK
jgi:hypothetical protein